MKLNEIIKKRRMELNLTIRDVALALGTAESTVSRYESCNIQNMRVDKIVALAEVLQCSPAYLLGCSNSPETNTDYNISNQFDSTGYTKEELSKIKEYAAFLKSQRITEETNKPKHFTEYESALNYLQKQPFLAAYGGSESQKYSKETIIEVANAIYEENG